METVTVNRSTAEELLSSENSLSRKQSRLYAGRTNYEGEAALKQALAAAKESLPKTDSAYKPSGKTTASAVLTMTIFSPLILLVVLILCGLLLYAYVKLEGSHTGSGYQDRRIGGWLGLIYDFALLFVMGFIPVKTLSFLGRVCKNRNPKLPAILGGLIAFITGVAFFCPIPWLEWETLAATHISFFFVPIRWLLILIGCIVFPFCIYALIYGKVAAQKFCEATGLFLKPLRRLKIEFDFAENALELLRQGQFMLLPRLPHAQEPKKGHYAEAVFWWHEKAEVGYLELDIHFRSSSKPVKKLTTEKSETSSEQWLAYSMKLDRPQCQWIYSEFPATG